MHRLLQKELDGLKKRLLAMSAVVEENLNLAIKAFMERDPVMAMRVEDRDNDIDRMEVDIEEECLKVLALHQPVAVDLRFVVSMLKMNNDLERIGDQSVNIAKLVRRDLELSPAHIKSMLERMIQSTRLMFDKCLDALIYDDVELAYEVCGMDDAVDQYNADILSQGMAAVKDDPEGVECVMSMIRAARRLERVADLSTNICEDVIYFNRGEIVRHRLDADSKRRRPQDEDGDE